MPTSGRRGETEPSRARWLDLDRLFAQRTLSARELIDLIHDVNTTGCDLDKGEAAQRCALKRRLQSELLQRYADEMEVLPDEREGVVLLRHKFLGLAASHATVADLDEQTRAWVRLQLDRGTDAEPPLPDQPEDRRRASPRRHERVWARLEHLGEVSEALEVGRAARDRYDFEAARTAFERAHALAPEEPAPLADLLDLLVNYMGLDRQAVDWAESVPRAALASQSARAALSLAAARMGDRGRALAWGQDLDSAPAAVVLRELATQALRAGDLDYASEAVDRARQCLPTDPERLALQEQLGRMRAAAMADEEAELARLLAEGFRTAALELARRIMAAHPNSAPARGLLRDEAARERRARQRACCEQARAACEQGRCEQARKTLVSARELGAPHDEVAEIERAIGEAEARAQQLAHEQALAQLRARLSHPSSPAQHQAALAEYAALDDRDRAVVRAGSLANHLDWLDEIVGRRLSPRAEDLAEALWAAHQATALLGADDAEGAERALAAQRTFLGDYAFGRVLLARVEHARRSLARAGI